MKHNDHEYYELETFCSEITDSFSAVSVSSFLKFRVTKWEGETSYK